MGSSEGSRPKVLVADDEPLNIKVVAEALKKDYQVIAAGNGSEALALARTAPRPDLVLLDVMMPGMDGFEACRRLKADPETASIPVVFITALADIDDEAEGLQAGAVDYITKPISVPILKARVRTQVELKRYRDRLEEEVAAKTEDLRRTLADLEQAHKMVRKGYLEAIHRLTLASEYKDEETGDHIRRVSYYTREIAECLGMDEEFREAIFYAAPMHDLGKVGIPDSILLKQGPLTGEEWEVLKRHTVIGAEILAGSDSFYLQMGSEIAANHHERWCGGGYPRGVEGEAIPLAGRIMNIVDQYDALRSKRPYKPGFTHEQAVEILTRGDGRTRPEHFDPAVLDAFKQRMGQFAEIFTAYS